MGMTSSRVSGLLLAAGAGRRFGGPKALVQDGQGPWLHRAVRALLDGGCVDVLVVTGAAAQEVEALVVGLGDPRVTSTCSLIVSVLPVPGNRCGSMPRI